MCHKCGYPFPNAHPSAKHRRAHKRVCGTIEGYKLVDSEHHNVSDDDCDHSDDERRTPSELNLLIHCNVGLITFAVFVVMCLKW